MSTQIRKILDMVQRERLSREDAIKLLSALSPRLSLGKVTWEHFFELQREGDFGIDELGALLEARSGARSPGPAAALGDILEGLPRQIGGLVDQAIRGRRSGAAGSILKIQVESADGTQARANVPLSLATHLTKLLPTPTLELLKANGLDAQGLQSMLDAKMPPGEILHVEDAKGDVIKLWIE
jgi:hypothetical protein